MNYNFEYYGNYMDEEMMGMIGVFSAIIVAVFAVIGIINLVLYILRSLALHTISKRRGLNNAWLSWVPVGQEWIIGSLSDQYKYVTQGKVQNRRKLLLGFWLAATLIGWVSGITGLVQQISLMDGTYGPNTAVAMRTAAGLTLVNLLSSGLSITAFVFRQMSMYDLYKSCNPKNSVMFLVLGIFFAVTEPFFLMSCRYKEEGMPPRRQNAQEEVPTENWTADPEPFVYEECDSPVDSE